MAIIITRSGKGSPLTNNEVDGNFTGLNTELTSKASLSGAAFTGPVTGQTIAPNVTSNNFITAGWFNTELGRLNRSILPRYDLGVDLGSPSLRFGSIYAQSGFFAQNTITIGDAPISASDVGGIILPLNTAIGEPDNVIPANLASTVLDKAFAISSPNKPLILSLVSSTAITAGSPVQLDSLGTVSTTTDSIFIPTSFIGIAAGSVLEGGSVDVILSGRASGLSNLVANTEYYINSDGTFGTTSSSTNSKVGVAVDETTLFVYSTTTIDTYANSIKKIGLTDLGVSIGLPASSSNLAYNSTSGIFTYTPLSLENAALLGIPTAPTANSSTNTSQIATTAFVQTAISGLIDSAPGTLDTLNELAAALGDDSNFASTISTALAGKADIDYVTTAIGSLSSLDSPTFTGIPTAPTAAPNTNTNQVATTAFVLANGGGLNIDGGTATTVRNTSTIALNGGGA